MSEIRNDEEIPYLRFDPEVDTAPTNSAEWLRVPGSPLEVRVDRDYLNGTFDLRWNPEEKSE